MTDQPSAAPLTHDMTSERIVAIVAVVGIVGVHALTIGYTYPALAFNMEARGFSSTLIGVHTAVSGIGVMVASLAAPWLVTRFSPWFTAVGSLLASIVGMVGLGLTDDVNVWLVLRLIMALGGSILFVVSEVWINQLAPNRLRGRIVGIYTSVVAGFFALGPLLIGVIGFTGTAPFLLMASIQVLLGAPIVFLRRRTPTMERVEFQVLLSMFQVIPLLLLVVVCFGYFDAALLGLWGVYALGEGVDTDRAAFLLTALIIGNVIFQLPIGWAADRMSRRTLLVVCAVVGFLGAVGLEFLDFNGPWIVPYLVIWGALSFGTYTLAMTLVGEKLRGAQLVAANAGFSLMWGVGNLIGALLTGPLMDAIGNVGFPISIALAYGLLVVATLVMVPVRVAVSNIRETVPPGESGGR